MKWRHADRVIRVARWILKEFRQGMGMKRNTKILCTMCERMVTLDGTTNGRGALILPWHLGEGWKKCDGSYRPVNAVRHPDNRGKRSRMRGEE